jgi:hypothetical protein
VGPHSRSGHGVEEKNSQPPPGIEPRSSARPAHRQSLYRLSYPGSNVSQKTTKKLILGELLILSGHTPDYEM